jgi:hypothetical protein
MMIAQHFFSCSFWAYALEAIERANNANTFASSVFAAVQQTLIRDSG